MSSENSNTYSRELNDVPDFSRSPKVTVELQFPIKIGNVQTGSIDMRRPSIGDRIRNGKIKGTDEDRELALFADLCQMAPDEILTLDLMDYFRLQETFRSFLGSARPETSA